MQQNNSLLCIGLDSDFEKIPECLKKKTRGDNTPPPDGRPLSRGDYSSRQRAEIILAFNRAIIDATKDAVCAYKPNSAFYEALGGRGLEILKQTIQYIRERAPAIPVILDAKRGDIGSTNASYVQFAFSYLKADAITLHPYLGREALQPFLDQKEKGIFVLCRTSNPGAGEFQDLKVFRFQGHSDPANAGEESPTNVDRHAPETLRHTQGDTNGEELYKVVSRQVAEEWNANGNCGLVVGATYPEELREVRTIVGNMPILVPGIGTQGGDVEKTVRAGITAQGNSIIVNSSRGIIFASSDEDFAEAAKIEVLKLRDQINQYR